MLNSNGEAGLVRQTTLDRMVIMSLRGVIVVGLRIAIAALKFFQY